LPHGYRVTFRFAPECTWEPGVPRVRSARAKRRFFTAYTAARDAFLADVATMGGVALLVADVTGDGAVATTAIGPGVRH
jgi:hypothetical protein